MLVRLWRRLRGLVTLRRVIKFSLAALVVTTLLLFAPVAYVELGCRGTAAPDAHARLITDPVFRRPEANTYLTYPEWHIVFAYDGLARALTTGDEHKFDYVDSIASFWSAACGLTRVADEHGGAGSDTRMMIHTIGVSFTAEMLAKAAYEETVGRMAAWVRGPRKTAQDAFVAGMAADYAAFLRQTPWYEYPFRRKASELWAIPVDRPLRGWERRLGMGLEFHAKAVYAKGIAGAVAATAPAQLVIRSIVSGIDPAVLRTIPGLTIVGKRGGGIEIETPRYALFTRILTQIARQGGTIREIAGNDEIMVSMTVPEGGGLTGSRGMVILRMDRDGIPGERLLINLRIADLAAFLTAHPPGDPGVEHVFDY